MSRQCVLEQGGVGVHTAIEAMGERSGEVCELVTSGLDLGAGVTHGVADLHGRAGGDTAVEGFFAEPDAQAIDGGGQVRHLMSAALVGCGAIAGGGQLRPFDAVEQHGQVGENRDHPDDETGAVE